MPQNLGFSDKLTLKNYKEVDSTVSISANRLSLNLNNGNIFYVSRNANITSFTFTNVPSSSYAGNFTLILENSMGAGGTITWPNEIKWPSGNPPSLTSTIGNVDIFTFLTIDGGVTWLGFITYQQG